MKVAQDQEGNKAKLYNEIVVKEAPKSRTIGAKIYKKVIMKETQNKREIIFKNYSKKKPQDQGQ